MLDKLQNKPPITSKNLTGKLLGGPIAAAVVGITIPALIVMLYLFRPQGAGEAAAPPAALPVTEMPVAEKERMAPEHAQVVEDMAARLEKNPDDGDGWYMLGHSYAVMGRYAEAVIAYKKAADLLPVNAQLLVDYADVLAVANDRNLRGQPMQLIIQALKLEPNNIKALALFGTAAFQAGDYVGAEKHWGKVLQLLPPESPLAQQMTSGVAEAKAMAAGKKTPSFGPAQDTAEPVPADTQAVAGNAQISGVLTLSRELAGRAAPTDIVFLSAKELGSTGSPIAVIRAEFKDLPLKFVLDESTAMMPTRDLSQYKEVMLSAKISKSGNPLTSSGDLIGEVSPVKVGASGIQVSINRVAP